jgi:CheY-like chemotaxis protein
VLAAELRPGFVTLLVRDQGIGVAEEHQKLIFQRFERVAESRNRGGFGLGLWIVRQIVEAHAGSIRVFSRPGLGSTFGVELPNLHPAPNKPPPLILLVDDDPAVREAFRQSQRDGDAHGLTAMTGFDALALLDFGVRPALILLDDEMPIMDGPTLFAELRADPRYCDIPVVWLKDRGAARVAAGEAALEKPFAPLELRLLAARHLHHHWRSSLRRYC